MSEIHFEDSSRPALYYGGRLPSTYLVESTQKGMDAHEEYKDKSLKKYDPLTSKKKVQHWFIFLEALSSLEDEGKSRITLKDVWDRMPNTGYRYTTASGGAPDKEQSLTTVVRAVLGRELVKVTEPSGAKESIFLVDDDDEDEGYKGTDYFYEFFEDVYGKGSYEAEIERKRAMGQF